MRDVIATVMPWEQKERGNMKKRTLLVATIVLIMFSNIVGCDFNKEQEKSIAPNKIESSVTEGSILYTPTKLEWLAMDLNMRYRKDLLDSKGFSIHFRSSTLKDTVIIAVTYIDSVDRRLMKKEILKARDRIKMTSKEYGWDAWVKISEMMLKLKKNDIEGWLK
jgi:hypothetical protein